MKISIVSPAYPYRGGIAGFTTLLYKELIKDHDVSIVNFSRQYPSILFPGKSQTDESDSVSKIPSLRLIDTLDPFTWFKAGKYLRKEKPDHVIFCYWMPFFAPVFGIISRGLKKNKYSKTLALCHNILPHEKKPFDKILTKYFFKSIDRYVLLSDSVRDDLHRIEKKPNYKLLFHPVYSNFGQPVDKSEARKFLKLKNERTILFFGLVREYKGLDILLKAISLTSKEIKCQLLVAGEFYSDFNKYTDLAARLGITGNVIFKNEFIPAELVKYYFSAADVVVLPYRSATQSGVTLVAKNFYKPVIATNVGGLSEIVKQGEDGYLVEPENPEQLSEMIVKFYRENKEVEFSRAVKNELDKLSWKNFTEKLIDFLKHE